MRTILILSVIALFGCQTEGEETPNCDDQLGSGWGAGYGTEVESNSNLDADRCVEIGKVWCCAM